MAMREEGEKHPDVLLLFYFHYYPILNPAPHLAIKSHKNRLKSSVAKSGLFAEALSCSSVRVRVLKPSWRKSSISSTRHDFRVSTSSPEEQVWLRFELLRRFLCLFFLKAVWMT